LFKIDDFIQLMRYFKGKSSNIDPNLIILGEDSKAKATILFNENIDLVCHTTEDYKRLKNFLIPWYASLRTFPATMRNASDVRSLPEDHLNKLINSFGFVDLLGIDRSNKVNLFYDLINLYKIKGTPEALERALGYIGMADVDLVEYWLKYDTNKNLIFHPITTSKTISNFVHPDIPFENLIKDDPHWFYSKEQINQLFLNNRIAFPSKSPYIGLRPFLPLSNSLNPVIAILVRIIQDIYIDYLGGTIPDKDFTISSLKISASILDLFLSFIYLFNSIYPKTSDTLDTKILVYNGNMNDVLYSDIIKLYKTLISRDNNSSSRAELLANRILFNNTFSRLRTTDFLVGLNTAGTILEILNPELKEEIDANISVNNETIIINILTKDLSSWVIENISSYFPLDISTYGFSSLEYITEIINFFKPYRARIKNLEQVYVLNNPLEDSLLVDDELVSLLEETIVDFDTANSNPVYQDFEPIVVTSTPPTDLARRVLNLYVDSTGSVQYVFDETTVYTGITNTVYSSPPIGCHRIINIYLDSIDGFQKLYIEYEEIPEIEDDVPTPLMCSPPSSYYQIHDVYVNNEGVFEILYNEKPYIIPNIKNYYSRDTYDNGSYFDIGASTDDPPHSLQQIITQNNIIIHNYHKGNAVNDYHYSVDPISSDISEIITDGGWSDFDTGMVFDSAMLSDVVQITVFE